MNQRIEKIKTHLVEHKIVYITAGVSFVVGGVTAWAIGQKIEIDISQKAFLNWKSMITQEQNINIALPARGHRGNVIQCDQTGITYPSQQLAAIANGIDPGNLSRYLNGKQPHVNGLTFKSFGENPGGITVD